MQLRHLRCIEWSLLGRKYRASLWSPNTAWRCLRSIPDPLSRPLHMLCGAAADRTQRFDTLLACPACTCHADTPAVTVARRPTLGGSGLETRSIHTDLLYHPEGRRVHTAAATVCRAPSLLSQLAPRRSVILAPSSLLGLPPPPASTTAPPPPHHHHHRSHIRYRPPSYTATPSAAAQICIIVLLSGR